eukprot:scaffold17.g428.t1
MSQQRKDPRALRGGYQERRRAEALERQRNARREQRQQQDGDLELDDAATSGLEPAGPEEVEMGGDADGASERRASGATTSTSGANRRRSSRQHYAEQLMSPEWLIEAPPDLGTDWYVLPRPEGQRCLVITSGGQTTARLRNGVLAQRFASALPGGGLGQRGGGADHCILDCVFHAADATFYVLDLVCWRGHSLYGCTTEFRLFWAATKLAEEAAEAGAAPTSARPRRFLPLPAYPATPAGLRAAHSSPVPFTQASGQGGGGVPDGIYFLHREAHYTPGQTPLALVWKDAACSRYLATLEYRMDRTVATHDDAPVVLGRMPEAFVASAGGRLRPGRLLRFAIGPGGFQFRDGQPVGADLHFLGPANQRRGRADSLSKIVFQHLARTAPITLDALLAAAAAAPAGGGDATAAPLRALGSGGGAAAMSEAMASDGGPDGFGMSGMAEGEEVGLAAGASDGIEVDGP